MNLVQLCEDPRRFRRLVFAAFVIGLLVRLGVLVGFWHSWGWQAKSVPDQWNQLAINLVDHGTFGFSPGESTIMRGPVFPLFEVPLYLVFGERYEGWSATLLLEIGRAHV